MRAKTSLTILLTSLLLALGVSGIASAAFYSFASNDGSTGIKNDINDLDHYKLYVWGIDPTSTLNTIKSKNEKIIGASITFANIYNWASEPNDILKVYLLDNPKVIDRTNNGIDVWSATDNQNTTGRLNELTDPLFRDKTNANYRFEAISPLWSWTDTVDGLHAQTPGSTVRTGHNLVYNFDANQLTTLLGYFSSKNSLATTRNNYATFGLGFDPDCHYFNDGITFTLQTAPVPEPGTMALFGIGILGLVVYGKRRLAKKES